MLPAACMLINQDGCNGPEGPLVQGIPLFKRGSSIRFHPIGALSNARKSFFTTGFRIRSSDDKLEWTGDDLVLLIRTLLSNRPRRNKWKRLSMNSNQCGGSTEELFSLWGKPVRFRGAFIFFRIEFGQFTAVKQGVARMKSHFPFRMKVHPVPLFRKADVHVWGERNSGEEHLLNL